MKTVYYAFDTEDQIYVADFEGCFNDSCYTDSKMTAKKFKNENEARDFIVLHGLKDCKVTK